jgi:transposase-like protein
MQHRKKLNGLAVPATETSVANAKVSALRRNYEYAQAEIKRLKLQLAQARDELDELSDVTADFVRLML